MDAADGINPKWAVNLDVVLTAANQVLLGRRLATLSQTDAPHGTFSLVLLCTSRPPSSLVTQATPPICPTGRRLRTTSLLQHLDLSLN